MPYEIIGPDTPQYEILPPDQPVPKSFKQQMLERETNDVSAGVRRGVKDVLDTGAQGLSWLYGKVTGDESEAARVKAMNDTGKAEYAATPTTAGNVFGRIGGNLLATTPMLAMTGAGLTAAGLPSLGRAVVSGGMSAGPDATMATRAIGGAINGFETAGLVDPDSAKMGAGIGAASPLIAKATQAMMRGSINAPSQSVLDAARQAQAAGYVIPPTQVNPSLPNRAMEGLAGKLTTAQAASTRNQPVTNRLAQSAIGAAELSPEGLQAVRSKANEAYSALGQFGPFKADDSFKDAVTRLTAGQSQLKADFPALANGEIEKLAESLTSKSEFGAQSTLEAIKQFRFDGSANKISTDPTKKALGAVQMKLAGALEDLVDRNLQAAGRPELLSAFRDARTTLAKVYDVEKALNASTGNVDASKLAKLLDKRRPLTGDLRTAAEFAQAFPKAAQSVERMGSLPGVSPLDFVTAAGLSGATGHPGYMAGVMLRPAARSLALSGPVQRGLLGVPAAEPNLLSLGLEPSIYRLAPLLATN